MAMNRKSKTNAEKRVDGREDELPWEVPLSFDPRFLPTSVYKTGFSISSLFPGSSSIQNVLEPYYSHAVNTNSSKFPSCNKSANMEPGTSGYSSACLHSPVSLHCLSQAREASSSCPTISIAPKEGTSYSGKLDVSTVSSTGKTLPPIGVFWDIENCAVPKGRSALVAVQRIREKFFIDHLEAEFVCVCDIRKEAPTVIQELNDAQVSVVHVAGNSKNAADDKLRQAMRRFADISCSNPINSSGSHPATIVLISGDINFATDLSDLRYRKRLYIILLHNRQTPDALLLCAHEHYVFHSILSDLPFRPGYNRDFAENSLSIPLKGGLQRVDILVNDLPPCNNNMEIKNFVRFRLRKLSENCGGKVMRLVGQWAIIRFPNYEAALRASKRMNGEDVLGNKIKVSLNREFTTSFDNCQTINFQEEAFGEHFTMQVNKSNPGLYTSWKPTWKRTSDSFNRSSSRYYHSSETNRYNVHSTTAASNSSTPNETSRDGSPNVMKPQQKKSTSSQATQLNNATQYQSSTQTHVPTSANVGSPLFAFHQNLYPPHMDAGMNTLRQECQTPSSHHQQTEFHGANGPRLYSTLNSSDANAPVAVQPLSGSNQHNFNMQLDLNKSSPPAGGNGIMVGQPIYAGETQSVGMNGNTGNYTKSRSSDGETFDLNVTNIDHTIGDWKTIRSALNSAFSEHVSIRGIWVYTANDGSASAVVRLNNKDDAHYAVAQLHRRKIGNKRIFISFDQGGSVDHETLKKEVASLLQDVPNNTLPLFKFREMFEKRYKRSVSSSDLYRMKDVVQISESAPYGSTGSLTPSSGRIISLTADWQKKDGKGLDLYCKIHPRQGKKTEKSRRGWAEKEAEVMLPNVIIEIKLLGTRVHAMLQSHNGSFPLISFLDCYEADFGPMECSNEGRGVPLEHLISCIHGIEIVFGENGMKQVQWNEKREGENNGVNSQLATQFTQFGRELIDLLKTFPKCTLAFSKLIPSYHTHFGRQCRVADYGHFSLSALLQTLPHIVQIMGAAQNRVLTLSHRAQMKRFATDTLRVLKSQGGLKKQIRLEDFPAAFNNVFPNRPFQPEDYGLCYFSDLVTELVENSALVALMKDEDGNTMLAVPKREQTPQEIHRTRIFATEVVELLRHSTRCELEFSKFVPYYHHHFQKQCRVSEYGFSKLAELFDAISDTVVVLNPGSNDLITDDKIIRLTPKEQTKVVGEQICNIVEKRLSQGEPTHMEELVDCFLEEHGFLLRPELCGAESLEDLVLNKLENYVKVEDGKIVPVDRIQMEDLAQKAELLLQQASEYKMELHEFLTSLSEKCENMEINAVTVEKDLTQIATLDVDSDGERRIVKLEPLRIFAHEMAQLLEGHSGMLPLPTLESAYFEKFGRPLRPAQLGYPTVLPMLQAIPDVVSLRGKHRTKKIVILNSAKSSLESSVSDESSASNGMQTPRSGSGELWKHRGSRPQSSSSGSRQGRHNNDWTNSPKRRSIPPPLYSPLNSPYVQQTIEGTSFGFDRPTPLSPPVYDVWMQEPVAAGSPPLSPPVVWTMHPIFYPSSPPPGSAGNILVTSPYVGTAPWSPPPVNTTCYDRVPPPHAAVTMLGSEFLFGQNRLTATFEGITMDSGNEA